MWHPISIAPFDRDLELAVIDLNGVRAIAFPCRRVLSRWNVRPATLFVRSNPNDELESALPK